MKKNIHSTCFTSQPHRPIRRRFFPPALFLLAASLMGGVGPARAASDIWTNDASGSWVTGVNWLSGTPPGATSGTTSADVATFGYPITAARTVTVDANRNIGGILFSNPGSVPNANYVLSGGSLLLSSGGFINIPDIIGTNNPTINTPITLEGNAYFTNNQHFGNMVLVVNAITGTAAAGSTNTLYLNGTNGSAQKLAGIISDGANGGQLAVIKNDSGNWRLAAANTFSGGVTVNAGTLTVQNAGGLGANGNPVTLNGGTTLTSFDSSGYTLPQPITIATNVGGGFILGQTANGTGSLNLSGNVNLGGISPPITVNNPSNTISGNISNGGISKWGVGILVLAGANNTYASDTSINNGTLRLGASNVIPDGSGYGNVNIGAACALDLNGFSDTINGLNSAGTVSNSAAGASTLTVGNNNVSSTFSGGLKAGTGAVALSKIGTGTLTLSGTNSFTGGMLIQAGQVTVSGTTNAFSGGITVSNGANLLISGSVANNAITNNGAVILSPATGPAIFGNSISGSGSVTNSTANNTTFTNVNSYTGGFILANSGNVTLNSPGVSMPGNINYAYAGGGCEVLMGASGQVANTAILNFATNAGGRFELQGFNQTIGGIQNVGGGNAQVIQSAQNNSNNLPGTLTLNVAGANAYNFGGNGSPNSYVRDISGGTNDALSIVKNGTGTQTFSGPAANVSYTGSTTVNAGVLEFSGTNSVANSSAITLGGGTVKFSGGGARSNTITGSGNVINAGAGFTLTLSGNNSYAGNTTNSAGTLALGHTNALGTSTLVMTGNTVLATTADLSAGNGVANAVQLASNTTVNNTNNLQLSGVVSGSGGLTMQGSATLTLAAVNTYAGGTTLNNGTVSIATIANGGSNSSMGTSSSAATNLVFGGGTLSYTGPTASSDRSFTMGSVFNTINVPSSGTTLTLTGSSPVSTNFLQNTGAGNVTLDPGAGSYNLGSLSANGGVLTLKSGTFTVTATDPYLGAISFGYRTGVGARGGTLVVDGATVNVTGVNSTNGNTFQIGATTSGTANILSGSVNASDYVVGHNGNALCTQSGGNVTVTNIYHYNSGNGTNTITGGTLTVNRIYNNPFNAPGNFTFIFNGGVVKTAPGTVNLIDYSGSTNTSTNEIVVQLGTNGATIDTSLSSAAIVLPLADVPGQSGQLVKIGTGTLTLSTNNTYSGSTIVSNGTLVVNGSLGTGAVTDGGTLSGVGAIGGATTVNAGALLAAGANGIGTLTISSNLTLNAASTNQFVVTTGGGVSNQVAVAGTLSPNSSIIEINTAGGQLAVGTYTNLFTYGTTNGTTFTSTPVFDTVQTNTIASVVDTGSGQMNLVISPAVTVSSDASLSYLALSPLGALSPAFSPGTTNYTATNVIGTTSVTVTVTNTSAYATNTLFLNGVVQSTNAGSLVGTVPVAVGSGNVISVVVTAQDGVTASTNTVTVTVLASTNALLSNLSISPGALSQTFSSGTTSYTATNTYPVTNVTVTATSADGTAALALSFNTGTTYSIPLTNGVASANNTMSLSQPANVLAVQVVSQDLSQTNVYTINELLQPSQTVPKLTNSVSGSALVLSWPADHLGYRLLVQTNNLNKGVSSNTNDWGTVAGSQSITTTNITIIKTGVTNEYYRLIYP